MLSRIRFELVDQAQDEVRIVLVHLAVVVEVASHQLIGVRRDVSNGHSHARVEIVHIDHTVPGCIPAYICGLNC